jgi:hypothetical protein
MPSSFRFEHVFTGGTIAQLFALYFDPARVAASDAATGIAAREVLERTESPDGLRRVCKVTPARQLPAFMRPFVSGGLHYVETAIWRRAADRVDLEVRPSLLGGRSKVTSTYSLAVEGDPANGLVRRIYAGSVSVEVALVGGRIERGIVADIERSLAIAARCTQDHLDRITERSGSREAGVATGT